MTKRDGMGVTKNVRVRRNDRCRKGQRGFSIIELVVVLAIIIALVAMAVPKTIETLRTYRLTTAVSMTSAMLNDARMSAIKRNRTTWLTLDRTAKTVQVRSTDDAGNPIDVGFPQKFPQAVNVNGTTSIDVSFDSLGRSSSGTQTFTIVEASSNLRKDITVSPAGKVSVGAMYTP